MRHGNPARMVCNRIRSGDQMGTIGGFARPDAAQCTTDAPRGRATVPRSNTISVEVT